MEDKLLPDIPLKPCGVDGLRVLSFLPFFFLKSSRKELKVMYMTKVMELEKHRMIMISA